MENSALELVGTPIQRMLLTMVPTSQGFVRLKSCNTNDMPLVDSNSYSTEANHHNMRQGLGMAQQMFLNTVLDGERLLRRLLPNSCGLCVLL